MSALESPDDLIAESNFQVVVIIDSRGFIKTIMVKTDIFVEKVNTNVSSK